MANKVNQLKSILGAAARPNKYRVTFDVPAAVNYAKDDHNTGRTFDILCKASSFPSMTIGQIEVFNQGRKLVIPGDTSYTNTWTLTFYQTEDHAIRKAMIAWMKRTDHWQGNSHSGEPANVMTDLNVEQLDSNGNATVMYTFHNAFVQEIGEITLGDDQQDTAMEFDVTFSFTDWTVGAPGSTSDTVNNPEASNIESNNAVAADAGDEQ